MKKKATEDNWVRLEDEVPPSDIEILVLIYGRVVPAKHLYAKFNHVGMRHYFKIWNADDTFNVVSDVKLWRKMPTPPQQNKKEFMPD